MLLPRQFSFKTLYFHESHFPKENFRTQRGLPLSRLSNPTGACPATAASQDPGIPHARRDLLTKGRAAAEAGAQPLTFTPRRTSSAEQHQHKAHSSAFDIRPFAFEKFFELREIKQNKTAEKNKEPEVTLSKLQIGNLIHLPAHRHTHLACLYLYA